MLFFHWTWFGRRRQLFLRWTNWSPFRVNYFILWRYLLWQHLRGSLSNTLYILTKISRTHNSVNSASLLLFLNIVIIICIIFFLLFCLLFSWLSYIIHILWQKVWKRKQKAENVSCRFVMWVVVLLFETFYFLNDFEFFNLLNSIFSLHYELNFLQLEHQLTKIVKELL